MAKNFLSTSGWLSFSSSTPRLYITAEDEEFDETVIEAWRTEGFLVEYLPMGQGGRPYREKLESLGRGLGVGEKYAIVAFGAAAGLCLELHLQQHTWSSRLCALIAYYPSTIPAPSTRYPSHIRVLVHLAGGSSGAGSIGVTRQTEILGIQGKRRTAQKRITPGAGAGGLQLHMKYRCYTYTNVDVGFAERDLDEYDGIADGVAWSRSLYMVRRAFGAEVEIERQWEEKFDATWQKPNAENVISTFTPVPEPYVLHAPTATGAVGVTDMTKFYEDYFVPGTLEERSEIGLEVILLSRTIGTDSVVDEIHLSFTHKIDMPWILPEIPPTGKEVDIVVICIVALRAGKLWCERIYWDQASVLVQVGLLDPKAVPPKLKREGVRQLPVAGVEAANMVLDLVGKGESTRTEDKVEGLNKMIRDW